MLHQQTIEKLHVLRLPGMVQALQEQLKQPEVAAFMDEMRAAKLDWQIVQYSGAVHSFTDPRSGTDNSKGAAYNADADRRSWRAMRDFFEETLAK